MAYWWEWPEMNLKDQVGVNRTLEFSQFLFGTGQTATLSLDVILHYTKSRCPGWAQGSGQQSGHQYWWRSEAQWGVRGDPVRRCQAFCPSRHPCSVHEHLPPLRKWEGEWPRAQRRVLLAADCPAAGHCPSTRHAHNKSVYAREAKGEFCFVRAKSLTHRKHSWTSHPYDPLL